MAYKVFTNGSVLNASEMNEYLMNQSVITFTNSTARGSAITTPVEGMITYLEDTQTYESWDGAAWVAFGGGGAATTNAIINGAFEINQRNFVSGTADKTFGLDRWYMGRGGDGTTTYSAQTFTPGTTPGGFESANFARIVTTGQTGVDVFTLLQQTVEDVRTFAGSTVTLSFYAKADSGTPAIFAELAQNFGSGGSPSSTVIVPGGKSTLSTSWQRFSVTISLPSISGKTIGTNANSSALLVNFWVSGGSNFNARTDTLGIQSNTFDIWGVQLEAGSVATPFRRNANSLQGELAACQRYYWRTSGDNRVGAGFAVSTTSGIVVINNPVPLRAIATSVDRSGMNWFDGIGGGGFSALTLTYAGTLTSQVTFTGASGLISRQPIALTTNSATDFIGFSAEL